MNFKSGILIDSLQVPLDEALEISSKSGADGIQLYAVPHEMSSLKFDYREAGSLKKKIHAYGLEISALCGDLGGHGFEREEENLWKTRKTKEIIDFAVELGVTIITTHIGVISENNIRKNSIMQDALRVVCSYAESRGVFLAIETGPEPAAVLKKFIGELGEKSLKVNFDPANLLMVQGESPVKAVYILKDLIAHTHAKDGRMIKKCNPVAIYNAFAEGNPDGINIDDYFVELPLGSGDVDFPEYIKALNGIGYSGYLTIEREAGKNRIRDVMEGIKFLKGAIK
jgi:L-ribulose-5-phosphate 3-epimerase